MSRDTALSLAIGVALGLASTSLAGVVEFNVYAIHEADTYAFAVHRGETQENSESPPISAREFERLCEDFADTSIDGWVDRQPAEARGALPLAAQPFCSGSSSPQ